MKTLSDTFTQRLIVSVVMASLFFGMFNVSNAQTTAPSTSSQAQIAQLQLQLASLQQQLSAYTTSPIMINSVNQSTSVEVGDRVQITSNVNVRSTPTAFADNRIATMPALSMGTVIGGPSNMVNGQIVVQPISARNSTFWQIQYDNGVTGWSGTLWVRDVSSDYGGVPAGTTAVTCDSFVFTPASVYRGESTTATWENSNGGRVFLVGDNNSDFNREFYLGEKSYTFAPTQTGLYKLKVIGANNTQATCVATIAVRSASSPIIGTSTAPACDYFKFTPSNVKKGATATLAWQASGVTSVSIASSQDQVRVVKPLEGSLSLTASGTIMYTLFGYSAAGQERPLCTATLVVQAVTSTATTPICNAFYFTPSPAIRNATTTATWETTNANRIILSTVLGGNIKSSSVVDGSHSFVVKKISEMYTLTAVGADGTRSACNFLLNAS